jgi:hypothetical protein
MRRVVIRAVSGFGCLIGLTFGSLALSAPASATPALGGIVIDIHPIINVPVTPVHPIISIQPIVDIPGGLNGL